MLAHNAIRKRAHAHTGILSPASPSVRSPPALPLCPVRHQRHGPLRCGRIIHGRTCPTPEGRRDPERRRTVSRCDVIAGAGTRGSSRANLISAEVFLKHPDHRPWRTTRRPIAAGRRHARAGVGGAALRSAGEPIAPRRPHGRQRARTVRAAAPRSGVRRRVPQRARGPLVCRRRRHDHDRAARGPGRGTPPRRRRDQETGHVLSGGKQGPQGLKLTVRPFGAVTVRPAPPAFTKSRGSFLAHSPPGKAARRPTPEGRRRA